MVCGGDGGGYTVCGSVARKLNLKLKRYGLFLQFLVISRCCVCPDFLSGTRWKRFSF